MVLLTVAAVAGMPAAASAIPPVAGSGAATLAAGKATVCAVVAEHSISCWGSSSDGQRRAPKGNDFASVAVGAYHACAVRFDTSVTCWGDNHFKQRSVPDRGDDCWPLNAGRRALCLARASSLRPGIMPARALALGKFHSCAVTVYESLACWGFNKDMNGNPAGQIDAPGDFGYAAVSAGAYHSCALKLLGSIVCWGANWTGQASPPAGSDFKAIAAGRTHNCALSFAGAIGCWGENGDGRATPPAGTGFKAISAGYTQTCAINSGDGITCWGGNSKGQLNAPSGKFREIAVGGDFGCARRFGGLVVCWGDGSAGQTRVPARVNPAAAGLGRVTLSKSRIARGTRSVRLRFNSAAPGSASFVLTGPGGRKRTVRARTVIGANSLVVPTVGLASGRYRGVLAVTFPSLRRTVSATVTAPPTSAAANVTLVVYTTSFTG